MSDANKFQVGGTHYQQLDPAPWDCIISWGLGYLDGNALKYIARARHKNGIEDLRKALHYLTKLIETLEASNALVAQAAKDKAELDIEAVAANFQSDTPGAPAPDLADLKRQVRAATAKPKGKLP